MLLTNSGMSGAQGGLGYAAFAVAMTAGRLNGDKIVQRWGGRRILLLVAFSASTNAPAAGGGARP